MLLNWIKKITDKVEGASISFNWWLTFFVSIILVRLGLENFSSGREDLFTVKSFPGALIIYAAVLLSMVVLLYYLTREKVERLAKIALVGWLAILISPVADLIISWGRENFIITYIFDSPTTFWARYLTFFGGPLNAGVTWGARTETIIEMLLFGLYLLAKTKSYRRAALGAWGVYTITFLYRIAPSLAAAIGLKSWKIGSSEIIDFLYNTRTPLFGLSFLSPSDLFYLEMSLFFFMVLIPFLVWFYFLYDRKKLVSVVKNSRILRFLFQIVAVGAGLYLGFKITGTNFDFSVKGLAIMGGLFFSAWFLWLGSVCLNDIYDLKIDQISKANQNRPLPLKILSVEESKTLAVIFFILGNLPAFILGYQFATFTFIITALTILYSVPPFRLRKFALVASGTMALCVLISFFESFILFSPAQSVANFPRELIVLILLVFTLVFNVKDIKDFEGDKADQVWTIPVIFGLKKGKLMIAWLTFFSFLLFPVFLHTRSLLWIALGFGLASFLLIYDKRMKEKYVFVIYSLFMIIVFLLT